MTDNAFLFFAAIIIAVIAQQVLSWLKQHNKKTTYKIVWPVILIYWIGLGLVILVGGVLSLGQDKIPQAVSSIALSVGLTLSGIAQLLERDRLRNVGVGILSIGPIVSGVNFIQSGSPLEGMIFLALGLGILISVAQGWPGGVGQMVIGAVVLGSSAILLINAWRMSATQVDFAAAAVGAIMLMLGLGAIIGGGITVIGSIKKSSVAALPSE